MQYVLLENTNTTPMVVLDPNGQKVTIKGISMPENPHVFYEPIIKWFLDYKDTGNELECNIQLEYFNSSSAKQLLLILKLLMTFDNSVINWYCADEEDAEIIANLESMGLESSKKINILYTIDE